MVVGQTLLLGQLLDFVVVFQLTDARSDPLGLNLVLLVNLCGAAFLSARFLAGRSTLHRLERWQTTYLPVFALWTTAVIVVLPPVFAFT